MSMALNPMDLDCHLPPNVLEDCTMAENDNSGYKTVQHKSEDLTTIVDIQITDRQKVDKMTENVDFI
jgi:hypothetical protein